MNPTTLASMCHDMIDNLKDCLEVLESPIDNDRDQLKNEWVDKIQYAYRIIGK